MSKASILKTRFWQLKRESQKAESAAYTAFKKAYKKGDYVLIQRGTMKQPTKVLVLNNNAWSHNFNLYVENPSTGKKYHISDYDIERD